MNYQQHKGSCKYHIINRYPYHKTIWYRQCTCFLTVWINNNHWLTTKVRYFWYVNQGNVTFIKISRWVGTMWNPPVHTAAYIYRFPKNKKSQQPCGSKILADKIISLAYIFFNIVKSLDLSIAGNLSLSCKIGLLLTDSLRTSHKLALKDSASMYLYRKLSCLQEKYPTNSKKYKWLISKISFMPRVLKSKSLL